VVVKGEGKEGEKKKEIGGGAGEGQAALTPKIRAEGVQRGDTRTEEVQKRGKIL